MGGVPATIDREGRDTLVDLMAYRFFVGGERRTTRDREQGVPDDWAAEWFGDDLALMSDLGCLPRWWLNRLGLSESDRAAFEIWLPPVRLRS